MYAVIIDATIYIPIYIKYEKVSVRKSCFKIIFLTTRNITYRLTVAGEATAKSCTSNTMCINGVNLILSLLARHNILLSSSTVFMFSIHRASTGPSQITQWWSSDVSWNIYTENVEKSIPFVLKNEIQT